MFSCFMTYGTAQSNLLLMDTSTGGYLPLPVCPSALADQDVFLLAGFHVRTRRSLVCPNRKEAENRFHAGTKGGVIDIMNPHVMQTRT